MFRNAVYSLLGVDYRGDWGGIWAPVYNGQPKNLGKSHGPRRKPDGRTEEVDAPRTPSFLGVSEVRAPSFPLFPIRHKPDVSAASKSLGLVGGRNIEEMGADYGNIGTMGHRGTHGIQGTTTADVPT